MLERLLVFSKLRDFKLPQPRQVAVQIKAISPSYAKLVECGDPAPLCYTTWLGKPLQQRQPSGSLTGSFNHSV
jgi:hypothetical protein